MSIYEIVKANVTIPQAAEHYGVEVQRNGMCCCPFHNDRHPSMKLNEDYFYCFGCGVHGDVIEFTARLFGLSSYEAAKKLAYDFGLDPDKPPAAAALKKPEYPLAKAFQRDEMLCQRVLCDYLHLLEGWKERYAPSSPEEEWDDRFVEACQMLDRVEYLVDVLTFEELEGRVKTVDMLKKDGTIDRLQERLNRLEKEVRAYGKEQEMD
ncbi:MAG: CHC2 zinc finger domain-containing protein [Candidatus Faecousia sp.]|nr:CHC2 zinc finger domain-containing protein [Candidatus Faecousia sp.]